jgi:hypothetical protein
MCTVSLLPRAAFAQSGAVCDMALRVVCSRDEQRARPAAIRPAVQVIGGRQVVMPIDPVGGGTWIAVNDRGLVFALLNQYGPASLGPGAAGRPVHELALAPVESRGRIIPALASSGSVSEALAQAQDLDPSRYNAFRLLVADKDQLLECWPEDGRLVHRRSLLHGPIMRTSSAMGDRVVAGPRGALFRHIMSAGRDPRVAQDAFHRHQWPGLKHISVRMERGDATTVSVTTIEIGRETASMIYTSPGRYSVVRVSVPASHDADRLVMCS